MSVVVGSQCDREEAGVRNAKKNGTRSVSDSVRYPNTLHVFTFFFFSLVIVIDVLFSICNG